MVGDRADFLGRLKSVLPAGWFPAESSTTQNLTPVLDAVLSGPATSLAWAFALIAYAGSETRLTTATDVWLDLWALDYFGPNGFPRHVNEADASYAARIKAAMLAPKGTRAAVSLAVENLTGTAPKIFEPANTMDTGGYGSAYAKTWSGIAYNDAGGYGSLALPFQCFITATQPLDIGVPNLGGYYTGSGWAGGGYGAGAIAYTTLIGAAEQVTDADIYATIAATMPTATIAWTAIAPPGA